MTVDEQLDPLKTYCGPCKAGDHSGCLWESRPSACGCACPWLVTDVRRHFASLRRLIEPEGNP